MTVTISNNYTILRAYTYPAYAQFQTYSFLEPILDYKGVPLFPSSFEPFHLLAFRLTTKVAYKGVVTTAFDFNQTFGSYNVAVICKRYTFVKSGDFLNFTYYYIHKLNTLGLV